MRLGTGPVFAYERLVNARRWQVYAARSLMVAALLITMGVIAWNRTTLPAGSLAREFAKLGELYFYGLIGVEMAIVMLAAPAATAGAICLDRARGTLDHMLMTDLSDAEIVLGKLGARLMPVLGLIACSWPVMSLATLFGGIDPFALTMAFAIIVSLALLGCTLALTVSNWARKPYEVVLVVYAVWGLILLAYPIWSGIARSGGIPQPPAWLLWVNPFYLAYSPYISPNSTNGRDYVEFLAAMLVCSLALMIVAVWRMRTASVLGNSRGDKSREMGLLARLIRKLPAPSLDGNPILWREWHRSRPSLVMAILAGVLVGGTSVLCLLGAVALWREGVEPNGGSVFKYAGVYSYVIQIIFGLLMLSAIAPMSLSEERQRGSLDVLLATPLSTRTIVLGKWLGTFRLVPWLVIGPGLVALALATGPKSNPQPSGGGLSLLERLHGWAVVVATLLVHGAAITSIGLLLATVFRQQARAIAISVTLFVLVSVGWPFLVVSVRGFSPPPGLRGAALSPIFTTGSLVDALSMRGDMFRPLIREATIWDVCVLVVAIGILELTMRIFDRHLGRISDPTPSIALETAKIKPAVFEAISLGE